MSPVENGISAVYTCGSCSKLFYEYKHLLEHLYWVHCQESRVCHLCGLKKWEHALHVCHLLPIPDSVAEFHSAETEKGCEEEQAEKQYCVCRRWSESAMIGCDGPECDVQWYHFTCVGIVVPPDGDWYCANCVFKEIKKKGKV